MGTYICQRKNSEICLEAVKQSEPPMTKVTSIRQLVNKEKPPICFFAMGGLIVPHIIISNHILFSFTGTIWHLFFDDG